MEENIGVSIRRGCQAPWNYHNDSNIPWCSDLNFMKNWFKNVVSSNFRLWRGKD